MARKKKETQVDKFGFEAAKKKFPNVFVDKALTQKELCEVCEDKGPKCNNCNSRQNDVEKPAAEPEKKSLCPFTFKDENCGATTKKFTECLKTFEACKECGNEARFGGVAIVEKKTDFTPPAAPEVPAEFTNYRINLRDLYRENDALNYRMSSIKAQLKANEKAIESINREFANGEYTGPLFKTDVSDAAPGSLAKREDAPDFDEFMVMVGENLSELADLETPLDNPQTMKAALYDFITSSPECSTARLLYGKVTFKPALFPEGEEPQEGDEKEYDHFIIPEFDDRTDFITAFVIEEDRAKYNERLEIWKKIQVEKQNESEAE